MRQYDVRREDEWSFADPGSSHPPIKPFRGRLGINHEGAGLHRFRASYRRLKKNSTDPALPTRWIDKKAVEQRNSLKRSWCHANDADDFVEAILCHSNKIPTNQW